MGLDYVRLFMEGSERTGSPLSVLSVCFLGIARIAPIITLSPFFGARIMPTAAKIGLAICFLSMILPKMVFTMTTAIPFNETMLLLFCKEILIGAVLGFFSGLPFLIVSSSGVLIDHQRGAASLMTNDPTIQNQSSPIGTLYNFLLITIFYAMDGPFYIIQALFESYDILPYDKFAWPAFLYEQSFIHDKIVKCLQIFVALTLQLCAPPIIAILMTDTFLGVINRLAPQVQITFLGMGLKSWLAILMVCIGLYPFVDQLHKQIIKWLIEFHDIVLALGQKGPGDIVPSVLPEL